MALSIFIDALPYTEMESNYKNWFSNQQIAELQPNIAYSSCLHWQLYCDKYPDDRGRLVDWCMQKEPNRAVRFLSTILSPLDEIGRFGLYAKKFFDHYVFRGNVFANIPFRFRKDFKQNGKYLFWDYETYNSEKIFVNYKVVSQDEGHKKFDEIYETLLKTIKNGEINIFFNTCFADSIGHKCRRGNLYSQKLKPYMQKVQSAIDLYLQMHPQEEVLIVSDHGMSTINHLVDLELVNNFGKESKESYIAYTDSCVMCLYVFDKKLIPQFEDYLSNRREGHLLSREEREYYKAEDLRFGDILYILKEGYCFKNNWFGQSIRPKKKNDDGAGMHGFWPERSARNQMASIVLINSSRKIESFYTYKTANALINNIMFNE